MAGSSVPTARRWIPGVDSRGSMPDYFLSACSVGDIEAAKILIENGFSPVANMNQENVWRIFINLCPRNHLNMIKFLFPQHIRFDHRIKDWDINEYYDVDTVPICVALKYCEDDNHDILKYFLDNGADIESDITIRSPYHWKDNTFSLLKFAVSLGRGKTVRYLVSRGASLKRISAIFMVRWACYFTNVDLLQFAIEHGAKFNDRSYLPLHWCITNPVFFLNFRASTLQANFASLLFYAPGVKVAERDFVTGDHRIGKFCPKRLLDMIRILLECGSNPNKQEPSFCMTAGHMVCRGDKVEQYRLLLAHGWDINRADSHGWTALHYAVFGNDPSAVKYLIENGAKVTISSPNDGFTPLHAVAAQEKHTHVFAKFSRFWKKQDCELFNSSKCEIIECLLSRGADVNAGNHDGETVAEMMCGREVLYGALSWLMENTSSKVPYNGKYSDLPVEAKRMAWFIYTDCLIPAGFQCREFIRKHLEITILADNIPEYRSAIYANPYAIYDIDVSKCRSELIAIQDFLIPYLNERYPPHDIDKELIISIMRDSQIGPYSSAATLEDLKALSGPPDLKQLAVFSIRQHLLRCNNNKSLFATVYKLYIPVLLQDMLCLKTFNDYTKVCGPNRG